MKRKSLLFLLLFALLAPWAANAQTVTVCDGTETSQYIPLYAYSGDTQGTNSEFIIPSTQSGMSDMVGKSITSMSFYVAQNQSKTWTAVYQVYMAEVAYTTLSANIGPSNGQIVYTGTLDASGDRMTIEFDEEYTYNGGNLLIGTYVQTAGAWDSYGKFYGVEAADAAYLSGDWNGYATGAYDFIPKTTFSYQTPASCPKPTNLICTAYTANTATLAWAENGEATNWVLEYGTAADFTGATPVNVTGTPSKVLTGLTAETQYYARVKADCGGGDQSEWSNTCTFKPSASQIVEIGDGGTTTNSNLPAYTFYNNNLTEQLYTAEEVGMAGDIVSLAFYNGGSTKAPNIKIYLVNTDKEAFASTTDWLTVTADDLVFEGDVTFTAGQWTTIEFDNSFFYDGTSNLGLIVDEHMTYSSGLACRVFTSTSNCSLYHYDDNVDYDATNPTSGNSSGRLGVKNQIQLGIIPGVPPTCPKPKSLAASNVTNHTATLSWTAGGEETEWTVEYSNRENYADAISMTVSNPTANLTGLLAETVYYARVKANCGVGDESGWVEVSFETEVPCPEPTNIAISNVEPFAATVSWTGTAANYNIRYRAARGFHYDFESAEGFVVDQFPPCTTYDGDGLPTYGIDGYTMPNNTANYVGSVVSFNEYWTAHSGNVMGVFMDAIPDEDVTANDDYFITPALTIASGDRFIFWARSITSNYGLERMKVGIYGGNGTISTYLAGSATEYVAVPVAWTEYNYDLTAYVGQTIQLAINCVSADAFALLFDDIFVGNPNDNTWDVTLNNVTSPYTLTGLTDETIYDVQVQAACGGEDGTSNWADGGSFTTPSNCAAPTNLAANDITYSSATLSWEGFHDTYNIQYRTAESRETYYFNDFNDQSIEGWTYDGSWIYGFNDPIYNVGGSSNYFMSMGWSSTEEETIISCELPAYPTGAHVEFYYFGYQTANTFQVGFSTTTNDADAFTWSDPINAPLSTYTLYNEELADGVKYIAWKATATTEDPDGETGNLDCVFIDDFGIFGETIEAGTWQTLNAVTSPQNLTGLADNTNYEWYVQGINPACDGGVTPWSHLGTFTTPNACQVPEIDSVNNVTFNAATVYWTGVQDSYNVRYTIFEPATMINFNDEEIPADWVNSTDYPWTVENGYIQSSNAGVASSTSSISFTATYETAGVISFDAMFMGEGTSTYFDKCIFSIDGNQMFAYGQIGQMWFNLAFYFTAGTHTFTWTYSKDSSVNPDGDFFAIDNVKVVLQSGTWTTVENVTGNSYNMTGLTPDAVIAVQVQGNNTVCDGGVTEWSEDYLFITDAYYQTLELTAGWNWISTYIEVGEDPIDMLLMLEEGLGENGLVIKNADYITTYEDEEWFGDLDDEGIFNEQMYMVKVAADCEVVLAGDPADPADHVIEINPGWNWIGFPYDQVLSLEDALADYEAEEGDALKDDNGITMYEEEEWFGDLETLVPGQGYMFYSASNRVKTLEFTTGEKAKRGAMPAIPNNLKKLTKKLNDSKQVKHAEVFKDMRAKK